uniref:Uncharacterized protein n=1 Tax=Cucumis melo TaxID=3656 RepID=A0A9I9E5C9_CUCME
MPILKGSDLRGAQHAKILAMLYAIDVEGLILGRGFCILFDKTKWVYLAWWLGVCSFKAKYLPDPSVGFIRNFRLLIVGESRKHKK